MTVVLLEGVVEERRLRDAAAAGEVAWRRFGLRLRSITPAGLVRFLLAIVAIALIGQLLLSAWRELLPLQIGLVVAYLALPLVDVLDGLLPRWLAALVVTLGEILLVLAFMALLVPPLLFEVPRLVEELPGGAEVRARLADLQSVLNMLPPQLQTAISSGLQSGAGELRSNLRDMVQVAIAFVAASLFSLLGTFGFVLGFIAVPSWLLGVLTAHRAGARALDRAMPGWMRLDFWAVVRIVDRTFGSYLRGQILRAAVFGCGLYFAMALLNVLTITDIRFPLSLAFFAAVAYLIPHIGPILGLIPALLGALTRSHQEALAVLVMFVAVAFLEQRLLAPRIRERSIDIPRVVLLPLLIAVSQFGLFWVVIAAPLIVVVRDLFLYVSRRFGNPGRPAGVLPDETWPLPLGVNGIAKLTS